MKRLLTSALVVAVLALPLAAQQRGSRKGPMAYDPSTEVTVSGVVDEVKQLPGGRASAGVHVMLKTEKEMWDVRLGPSRFLDENQFTVAQGDQLQVIGSKVKIRGADAILAREVKKGEKTLTLRDNKGIPKWSRGGRKDAAN